MVYPLAVYEAYKTYKPNSSDVKDMFHPYEDEIPLLRASYNLWSNLQEFYQNTV